jgi:peptide/nickel transport system permease protein
MQEGATQVQMDEMRQELGLDRPFLVRLVDWYAHALRGDLGESITYKGTPVAELIAERWPVTFIMTAIALVVALVTGVSVGVLAALRQGRLADWMLMVPVLFAVSMPYFWLGLILIILFGVKLRWLPIGGYVPLGENPIEFIRHMILPCTALGLVYAGMIARMTRTCVLEVLNLDYVQTARAKGLPQRAVIFRHALRNALIPLSTVVGLAVGAMLGGAVITETVFNIRGLGRLIVDGILSRDFPVVQGGILVVTVGYLVTTLVVDLGYAWLDPRIRYE